jgi:4-amino-4-deoxy-L-arabinose transferase-like glycosyltransferase
LVSGSPATARAVEPRLGGWRASFHAAARSQWTLVVVVALLVRLVVVLATPDFRPNNDPLDYDRAAVSIAAGHGFPPTAYAAPGSASALRPPAYPVALAATFKVFGHSYSAARGVGALFGLLAVVLIGLLGQALWGRPVGFLAAWLAAVFPPLVWLNASLLSEALFLPLELGAVLLAIRYRSGYGGAWSAVAAGALCGAAGLTRSVGLALIVLVWLAVYGSRRPTGTRLRAIGLTTAACVLVIAPWTARNAVQFHAFVPVSTQGGPTVAGTYNASAGTHDRYFGMWRNPLWLPEYRPLLHDGLDEAQIDREMRRRALDYAREHPAYPAAVTGLNVLRLFDLGPGHSFVTKLWDDEMGVPRSLRGATSIALWLVTALAMIGLVAGWRRRGRAFLRPGFVWLVPALMFASVVWIHGGARYRAPVDPFIVLLAAYGLAAAWPRVARALSGTASGGVPSSPSPCP